uniref:Uncharacterized protein n=1 Tax=Lepeophtheirus salmonis TaxID=72036 RepID=A0A0K2T0I1_LEPSM
MTFVVFEYFMEGKDSPRSFHSISSNTRRKASVTYSIDPEKNMIFFFKMLSHSLNGYQK